MPPRYSYLLVLAFLLFLASCSKKSADLPPPPPPPPDSTFHKSELFTLVEQVAVTFLKEYLDSQKNEASKSSEDPKEGPQNT